MGTGSPPRPSGKGWALPGGGKGDFCPSSDQGLPACLFQLGPPVSSETWGSWPLPTHFASRGAGAGLQGVWGLGLQPEFRGHNWAHPSSPLLPSAAPGHQALGASQAPDQLATEPEKQDDLQQPTFPTPSRGAREESPTETVALAGGCPHVLRVDSPCLPVAQGEGIFAGTSWPQQENSRTRLSCVGGIPCRRLPTQAGSCWSQVTPRAEPRQAGRPCERPPSRGWTAGPTWPPVPVTGPRQAPILPFRRTALCAELPGTEQGTLAGKCCSPLQHTVQPRQRRVPFLFKTNSNLMQELQLLRPWVSMVTAPLPTVARVQCWGPRLPAASLVHGARGLPEDTPHPPPPLG